LLISTERRVGIRKAKRRRDDWEGRRVRVQKQRGNRARIAGCVEDNMEL
jgi:hypothetical protein